MNRNILVVIFSVSILLVGCGSGGSSEQNTNSDNPTKSNPPVVSSLNDNSSVALGMPNLDGDSSTPLSEITK